MMSLYSTACYNIAMHSVLLLIRQQMKAGGIIVIARRPTPLGDSYPLQKILVSYSSSCIYKIDKLTSHEQHKLQGKTLCDT